MIVLHNLNLDLLYIQDKYQSSYYKILHRTSFARVSIPCLNQFHVNLEFLIQNLK